MADRNTIRRVVREFALKRADVADLQRRLSDAKETVYLEALRDAARQLGIITQPQLSSYVRAVLLLESGNHARSIVNSFNRDLAHYAFQYGRALDESDLRLTLRAWRDNRNAQRAPIIAVTEVYGPYADALMAAFTEAGLADHAEFDFGGQPEQGDVPAECAICIALERTNPHPLREVVRIGTPHPNCRQNWHVRNLDKLLELVVDRTVRLGERPAGIINRPSLIHRAGSRRQAAEAIRSRRLPR